MSSGVQRREEDEGCVMATWQCGVQLRKGDEQRREGCFAAALRRCASGVRTA